MEFFEKLFFLELVDYEDELEAIDEVEKGTDKKNSEANGTEENDNDKNGAEIEEEEEKGITRFYSKIVFNLQTTPHITSMDRFKSLLKIYKQFKRLAPF